jgi:hypothetical protein
MLRIHMTTNSLLATLRGALLGFLLLGVAPAQVVAFPPALPHTVYGMVRDELGNPLAAGATIILESASGVKVFGVVSGLLEPGVNYRLSVPLDAGLTSAAYRPTALNPRAPFKIRVKIGSVSYLPIEMSRDFATLGEPGKRTLLNLTLGEDSNGDGLPDAWQRRINADLSKVAPGDDTDRDGMSNLDEYLAGTYAYDPQSGFVLDIVRSEGDVPVLEFTAINGRSYSLQGSTDLGQWVPVPFRLVGSGPESQPISTYAATDIRRIQVQVANPAGQPIPQFFKLILE